jgi:hypothetical protein
MVGTLAAGALNAGAAFAVTVGIGEAACVWLGHRRRGLTAPDDEVRRAFAYGLGRSARKPGHAASLTRDPGKGVGSDASPLCGLPWRGAGALGKAFSTYPRAINSRQCGTLTSSEHRVLDAIGIAAIRHRLRKPSAHTKPALRLPQQQQTRIGGLGAAVKIDCEFLAADRWQLEGKQRIVGHGGCGARGELAALRITVKDAQEPRPHGRGTKERGAGAAHDHKEAKQNGLSGIAFSPCESASQAFRFQSG